MYMRGSGWVKTLDLLKEKRMRICIATHTLVTTDGQGRINYEIARYLARQRHELVLISTIIDPVLAALPGVTWREVSISGGAKTALLRYAIFSRKAKKIIASDDRGFDIVQLNGDITSVPSDVNIAMFVHSNWIKSPYHTSVRRGGLRAVYQRLFTQLHGFWERREFRRTRRAVALSEMVRQSLIDDVGLAREMIEVIPPGVDVNEFRPLRPGEFNPLRELIGVDSGAFVIFFAGDLISNRKNVDLVLEAMKELPPHAHLVCAGNYATSPYLAMANQMGLVDRVHFIGKRKDLGMLFRAANVFAFPSHYDTFALVVTEAMASGLPVITSPSTGAASFIENGKSGIVLQSSSDLAGMVAALKRLSSDRTYAKEMGRAARAAAEAWTWEHMARRYEGLFRSIIAEKSAVATPAWDQSPIAASGARE
jgi:glycosyltransferase involved in cell wall biosynthesis